MNIPDVSGMSFGTVRSRARCSEPPTSSSLLSESHLGDPEDADSSCYAPATKLTKRSTLIPLAVSLLELRINVTSQPTVHDLSILRTSSCTQIIQRSNSSHFPGTRICPSDSYIPPFLRKNVPSSLHNRKHNNTFH